MKFAAKKVTPSGLVEYGEVEGYDVYDAVEMAALDDLTLVENDVLELTREGDPRVWRIKIMDVHTKRVVFVGDAVKGGAS